MKFTFKYFDRTALHIAVEKENLEIIKLLMNCESINPSLKAILY